MENYLDYLYILGDNEISFLRKINYVKFNYSKYINKDNSNMSVLEIGPGTGSLLQYLNKNNISNIDVIDNDSSVLQFINKTFTINKVFRTNNLSTINKMLQEYDLIFMLQVFEHFPKTAYVDIVQALFCKLKKGGSMIIMVPNGGNPLNILERYHDLQHENAFTEDSLKEIPNYCELNNYSINIEAYKIPPYSIVNVLRIIAQKILHIIVIGLTIINGGAYQRIMTPNITLVIRKIL